MDFLKDLLAAKGSDLVSELVGNTGLDTAQAERFVPEAAGQAMDKLQSFDAGALGGLLGGGGGGLESLVQSIDVASLAQRVGIPKELAESALGVFLPKLMELLGSESGGAEGLASLFTGGKGGGLLGGLGKLLGS